jgi:hypothetical protein
MFCLETRCWAMSRHPVICLLARYLMMLSTAKSICQLMNKWMNVEHLWNDIGRKQKQSEKNLSQCHSVHKPHTDWPQTEPGLCSEKPVDNHVSHGTVPITSSSEAFTTDLILMYHEYFSDKKYILKYKNINNLFFLFTLFLCWNFVIMTFKHH